MNARLILNALENSFVMFEVKLVRCDVSMPFEQQTMNSQCNRDNSISHIMNVKQRRYIIDQTIAIYMEFIKLKIAQSKSDH